MLIGWLRVLGYEGGLANTARAEDNYRFRWMPAIARGQFDENLLKVYGERSVGVDRVQGEFAEAVDDVAAVQVFELLVVARLEPGQVGALPRRGGLCSGHLSRWRPTATGLRPRAPGPPSQPRAFGRPEPRAAPQGQATRAPARPG